MKKFVKAMTAIMMAFAAVAATGTAGVLAENAYTPVAGGTVQFMDYIVYPGDANAPKATFGFTLTASGNAIAPGTDTLPVYSGDNAAVTGTPTVGSASFTNTSQKYTEVQTLSETTVGQKATQTNDPVDLTGGKAYSRTPVTIDFTNVTFSEPGVYRWKVTQDANAAAAAMGITVDSADHFIDVYVDHSSFSSGTGTLAVIGYVFHTDGAYSPTTLAQATEPTNGKAKGFTDTYETFDLLISNAVAGNQGSADKYFKFEVAISNAGDSTKIAATGSFDSTVGENASTDDDYEGATQPASITTGSDGTITQVYYLQHNQNVRLTGIPTNAAITVTETPEDYTATVTAKLNGASESSAASNPVSIAALTGDSEIAFTNTKAGTIPTGIITNVLPGMMIVLVGAAGIIVAMNRRKAEQN